MPADFLAQWAGIEPTTPDPRGSTLVGRQRRDTDEEEAEEAQEAAPTGAACFNERTPLLTAAF